MKEEVSDYNEREDSFRVLAINKEQFVLVTNKRKLLFNIDK